MDNKGSANKNSEFKGIDNFKNKSISYANKSSSRVRKKSDLCTKSKNKAKKGSLGSSKNLPPKTGVKKQTKFDNYFTQKPKTQQLSLIAAKNMNTIIKNNICQGNHTVSK